ncbi:hypothetical protein D3C81_2061940 [compost metagenome]
MLYCCRLTDSGHTHNNYIGIGTISTAFPGINNNKAAAGVFSQIIAGAIIKPATGEWKSPNEGAHGHDFVQDVFNCFLRWIRGG